MLAIPCSAWTDAGSRGLRNETVCNFCYFLVTLLGHLFLGTAFLWVVAKNRVSSNAAWANFGRLLSWVPHELQRWVLSNSLKLEGCNPINFIPTWLPLRQSDWSSPSNLRGPGGRSILGFPSKISNRLRPQVVMAVRDPLPGLQSNKVTYVGEGQTLAWNSQFYYVISRPTSHDPDLCWLCVSQCRQLRSWMAQ